MKLIMENWRHYIQEMSFARTTKTVIGFDFDHTLARTAGGQVAYFDPKREWRATPGATGINPKYFETHEKKTDPNQGGENPAAAAPLNDSKIAKILAMPNGPEKQKVVLKYMACDGSRPEAFWCPSQAQLDFFTQKEQWGPLWADNPESKPDCWAFDFSSRDTLGWEQGTPEASQQVPVMKAFAKAVKSPNTEVLVLTSRDVAVESQIPQFLKAVGAPQIAQEHIKGCAGCNKGEFLYNEVLSNEKDYDIANLAFYDDSEANISTVAAAIKKAVDSGLIEGKGIVYRVDKHSGAISVAHTFEAQAQPAAAGQTTQEPAATVPDQAAAAPETPAEEEL